MYTNFLFGVENGLVLGGFWLRLSLKALVFSCLFTFMCLNFKITTHRLLIFLFFGTITFKNLLSFSQLEGELFQIYNLTFFMPLVFSAFTKLDLEYTYTLISKIIFTCLIFDLGANLSAFDNRGISGGVGNPSSFALALVVSSIIYRRYGIVSSAFRLATVFTGAAFPVLLAFSQQLIYSFYYRSVVFINAAALFVLFFCFFVFDVELGFAAQHAFA